MLEKINKLESQEGSLDNQSFPVVPNRVISPNTSTPEKGSFATSAGVPKNGEQPSPTYDKQASFSINGILLDLHPTA